MLSSNLPLGMEPVPASRERGEPRAHRHSGLNRLLAALQGDEQKMLTDGGHFGTADEIAAAVVFLASDDGSYMTGAEMFVDGGQAQV